MMKTCRPFQFAVLMLIGIAFPLACNSSPAQTSQKSDPGRAKASPTTSTAANGSDQVFSDKKLGIAFNWQSGWHTEKHPDYELFLVPDNSPDKEKAWVSLDVPDLPAIAKFVGIPLGKVKNGYIDDLKEKEPNLTVEEDAPFNLPRAKAQRVVCTWTRDGVNYSQKAICIVHDSSVYIIRGHADQAHEDQVKKQFDAIVGSIQWVK